MNGPDQRFSEQPPRDRFDLIATFTEETQARRALAELRAAGFGPDQALLLQAEEPASSSGLISPDGQIKASTAELLADRAVAIWIIISTEFVVGALAGAVVGWLVALFLNAPNIEPVWFWMLILGAAGSAGGVALGSLEWRKWKRQLDALREQTAIGMRFTARKPAGDMARARAILEQQGASGIDNT